MTNHYTDVCEATIESLRQTVERQAVQIEMMRSTLQGIVGADWRKWEEPASPEEFVRWAKSRANHVLSTSTTPQSGQFLTHIRVITELPKGELK